jgi:glutathione S-transferase
MPVIIDRGLPIHGLYHILSYLEDQYPEPPLCFDTPDRRAMTRMAVDQIITDLYAGADENHPTFLALAQELAQGRFVMERLSLLDLALVPVSPPGPMWDKHRKAVLKAIAA